MHLLSISLCRQGKKMAAEMEKGSSDVVVIPYPGQGHINPTLAFAKCLASKGLHVNFIITTNLAKSAAEISDCTRITIHTVSDGSEHVKDPESIQAYFQRFQTVLSANLANFMDDHKTSCVIYDSAMPWVLEIAHDRGLLAGPFFTQSCAVSAVLYHMKQGLLLRFPYEEEDAVVSLPSLPPLETRDLPSYSYFYFQGDSQLTAADLLNRHFVNIEKADWIFFNTFDKLEYEIMSWMENQWAIKTVGPTFLLQHDVDDGSYNDKLNHTISMFEPKHDACREWLDSKQTGSVVYVSLGSVVSFGKEQMHELAFGLIMSNYYFLWVVRSSEVDKLPQNFTSLASDKGLIVEWCHQPEVLAHRALTCFVSHCGWNSTLEAISYGIPIVAIPQLVDQTTNSKFVEDVWRFGIRPKPGENGIISKEEIAMCIKKIVDGDEGVELKANACKWKGLANEAVQKGGTSANNIEDFVSSIFHSRNINVAS